MVYQSQFSSRRGHPVQILNGKVVSEVRRAELKKKVVAFQRQKGRPPALAVVLVGSDPASQVYVRNKLLACQEVGIRSIEHRLADSASSHEVEQVIRDLNQNSEIDAILLQLPLPQGLDAAQLIELIDPSKDPDGLTTYNQGLLLAGRPRVASCTPLGVMKILEHYQISPAGKYAVVVGRSQIVGKPMAQLLLAADATVTVAHSKTPNLQAFTSEADILVVAAGRAQLIGKSAIKAGAVVIDVGIHRVTENGQSRLVGDVNPEGLDGYVGALTPVPGGVGPMTITMLLENTLALAESH